MALKALTCVPVVGIFVPLYSATKIREKIAADFDISSPVARQNIGEYINGFRVASLIQEILTVLILAYLAYEGIISLPVAIGAGTAFLAFAAYRSYQLYQSKSVTQQPYTNARAFINDLVGCIL